MSLLLDHGAEKGIRMTSFQYNMLYSLYAWPNVVIVFVGGYFVDHAGPRVSGAVLIALVTAGQSIMTYGAHIQSLLIIFVGRVVFAAGAELLIVVQGAMIFKWFSDKEIAVAFGFSLTSGRLGTILCFAFVPAFGQKYGVAGAFGTGAVLCTFSAVVFLVYVCMDLYADKVNGNASDQGDEQYEDEDVSASTGFSTSYWLCVATITTNYGGILAFLAVAMDLMEVLFRKYQRAVSKHINAVTFRV